MTTLRGLYAVTPDMNATRPLLVAVAAAVSGGCRIVQYRNKTASATLRREQAAALASFCKASAVCLIINDDVELALAVNAGGVHLGGDDGDLAAARARLGSQRLLGASCYADLHRARKAVCAGADYVAFGAVYPSPTKPAACRASFELLREARRELDCPIVAIGGITIDNSAPIVASGADMLAVITDLFECPDIANRARQFQSVFFKNGEELT
jgi:thiamine-phosphate pyrophosphorylase